MIHRTSDIKANVSFHFSRYSNSENVVLQYIYRPKIVSGWLFYRPIHIIHNFALIVNEARQERKSNSIKVQKVLHEIH